MTSYDTRINTPTVNSTLPVVVNGILVGFRNEYNRLGSGGKSARKHYAAIAKAAAAGHARVKAFKIAANGDRTLKACALQGSALRESGAWVHGHRGPTGPPRTGERVKLGRHFGAAGPRTVARAWTAAMTSR